MRRNRQDVYARWQWWSDGRHERVLRSMVPARLRLWREVSWAGKRVLDLGCGGGFMARALVEEGARVTGVDPCLPAVRQARDAVVEGSFVQGSALGLPFGDATFDHVVCVDVLEHIPDWRLALAEVARVLRPGGRFLYDTLNRTFLARWLAVDLVEGSLLDWVPAGTHDPALFIRPAELAEALRQVGLLPHPTRGLGVVGLTRRLEPIFGPVPFTAIQYAGQATRPEAG